MSNLACLWVIALCQVVLVALAVAETVFVRRTRREALALQRRAVGSMTNLMESAVPRVAEVATTHASGPFSAIPHDDHWHVVASDGTQIGGMYETQALAVYVARRMNENRTTDVASLGLS